MTASDKFRLGYGDYRYCENLSYENEISQSVFNGKDNDFENLPLYKRLYKSCEMQAVPPPMTGNYMSSGPDIKIDDSQYIYGPEKTQPSETESQTTELDICDSNISTETFWIREQGLPCWTIKTFNGGPVALGMVVGGYYSVKNKVLFTDSKCLVLSPDFKLPDENQILLKVPRQNNMYSFNLENIVPLGGLACLIAKGKPWIKREYSNARTPQQNGVAERKNRTLIEAARTMLADSFLPNTFWAEAVSTACYVLNRVLVTKPHNKTPYELLTDHLGKFAGKSDEGFLVGYSLQSKAFRIVRGGNVQEKKNKIFLDCSCKTSNQEKEANGNTEASGKNLGTKNLRNWLIMEELLNDSDALEDESWVDANARENLLQFEIQKVWILVDLPYGKKGYQVQSGFYRNKKDERGVVVRNKARLVAQGTQAEEGNRL
ncbi:retrovirus-related pol polyprotein from transposon TNT 1-94 [Tanacetum coccineum]